jgi:hypothetical protein
MGLSLKHLTTVSLVVLKIGHVGILSSSLALAVSAAACFWSVSSTWYWQEQHNHYFPRFVQNIKVVFHIPLF